MTDRLVDMLEQLRSDQAATTEALLEQVRALRSDQGDKCAPEAEAREPNADQDERVWQEDRQGATNSAYYRARLREPADPESLKRSPVFHPRPTPDESPATQGTFPAEVETRDAEPRHAAPPHQFEAVVIHQMGKVGSYSIYQAILGLDLWPCFHTHVLNPSHPWLQLRDLPRAGHTEVPRHIPMARELRSQYLDRGRPVVVITPIREPIGRNISAFFQNLDRFLAKSGANDNDPHDLYELFRSQYPHRRPQRWIEEELNQPFGLDIFHQAFPEQGTLTVNAGPHRVLVLKASLPDVIKALALGEYLGVDALTVPRLNVTERNVESEERTAMYGQFKKLVGQDHRYIEEMLSMRFTAHFFTERERQEIRERWLELGRT